jgi:hypothetical protein
LGVHAESVLSPKVLCTLEKPTGSEAKAFASSWVLVVEVGEPESWHAIAAVSAIGSNKAKARFIMHLL